MAENQKPEVNREVVRVGFDFRPLPLDVGDGIEWSVTADPDREQFGALQVALGRMQRAQAMLEEAGDTDVVGQLIGQLEDAVAGLIIDPAERKKFKAKGYGLMALARTATAYITAVSGFPTE